MCNHRMLITGSIAAIAGAFTLVNCVTAEEPRKTAGGVERKTVTIKNGTFYLDGVPTFLVGPFMGWGLADVKNPRPGIEPDHPLYPLYSEILNARSAKLIGFNSAQPQTPTYFLAQRLAPELFERKPNFKASQMWMNMKPYEQFFKNYNGLPVIADFAEIGHPGGHLPFNGRFVRQYAKTHPEIKEKFPNSVWQKNTEPHAYMPFCLDTPKGWEVLRAFYETGVAFTLENGGNPFAYELINEAEYQCRCKWNKEEFARRMKAQYGDIARANRAWRTSFEKFEEIPRADEIEGLDDIITWGNLNRKKRDIAQTRKFEDHNGLWIDWLKFSGDRFVEILKKARGIILKADRRDNIYFLSQPHTYRTYLRHNGMDEVKNSKAMDIIGLEGGVYFGQRGEASGPYAYLDLEAYGGLGGGREPYFIRLDMARSLGKPMSNDELNIKRFYQGKRFPSKRTDLTTSLWEELIHGVSSDMIYTWSKWTHLWKTLDEARDAVLYGPGYRAAMVLNPYNYPPDSLLGVKDFTEEVAKLREIVLPRPRTRGKIALVVSQPTIMQQSREYGSLGALGSLGTNPYEEWIVNFYKCLLYANVRFDVIYEEQLENGSGTEGLGALPAREYQAIVIPHARHVYNETTTTLNRYVQNGGVVIATDDSFGKDEYGNPLKEEIARSRVNWISDDLFGRPLQMRLVSLLESLGAARDYKLTDPRTKNDYFGPIEIQLIDRGKTRLYYFCNWGNEAVLARFHILDDLPGGDYRVIDPVTGAILVQDNRRELWNASDLRSGVLLSLPSQVRKILVFSSDTKRIAHLTTTKSRQVDGPAIREEHERVLARERIEKEKSERTFKKILDEERATSVLPRK